MHAFRWTRVVVVESESLLLVALSSASPLARARNEETSNVFFRSIEERLAERKEITLKYRFALSTLLDTMRPFSFETIPGTNRGRNGSRNEKTSGLTFLGRSKLSRLGFGTSEPKARLKSKQERFKTKPIIHFINDIPFSILSK